MLAFFCNLYPLSRACKAALISSHAYYIRRARIALGLRVAWCACTCDYCIASP
jgi:hypothetical protein